MSRRPLQRRQVWIWVLSLLVVLSMLCALVATLTPTRPAPTPTGLRSAPAGQAGAMTLVSAPGKALGLAPAI